MVVGGQQYHVSLVERDVATTVDTEWSTGGGATIVQPFHDRVIDLFVVAGADTLFDGELDKYDLAVVSGADIVEGATLCCSSFRRIDAERSAVRFYVGLYVPDTDVGDSFDLYVSRSGITIEVIPLANDDS